MRDHSNHIELTRDEAVAAVLAQCPPTGWEVPAEPVPVDRAFGRVLARDVLAAIPAPTCLTCQMDSVALRWADLEGLAEGELPDTSTWERGVQWQFANTGVAMPDGFDTALRIEEVEVAPDEQSIRLLSVPPERGAGTRPAGSQHEPGDVLARAGEAVTPMLAARIAGGNNGVAYVARRPRVAFIATGNELVPAGCPPLAARPGLLAAYGKTVESNSVLVRGLVEQWGGEFLPLDIVADDFDCIKGAVAAACAVADIVVLNGGSSKGSDDWCVEVLEEAGEMICHQMAHGPGRHSSLAVVDGVPVVGVSGPPAGAEFALRFYLRPLVRAYLGIDPAPATVAARLAEDFPKGGPGGPGKGGPGGKKGSGGPGTPGKKGPGKPPEGFRGIRPVRLAMEDGELVARPAGGPGSPGALAADGLCLVKPGPHGPHAGDVVEVELKD